MEGAPFIPEYQNDDQDRREKHIPKAESIGSLAVESKPEKIEKHSPEMIGHVLVDSESNKIGKENKSQAAMNKDELLKMSESIIIDGNSLRSIFDSHLIGERGLRKLIAEHMKGGDMKSALNIEIVQREIDFERDPAMRDHHNYSGDATNQPSTIDDLLGKANTEIRGDTEEVSFLKAQARYKKQQVKSDQNSRRMIDIAMVSTIVVLSTLVAVLLITNR